MDSVTEEKLNKLKEEFDEICNKISTLESKTNKDLWNEDIEEFGEKFDIYQSKLEKTEDLSKLKISSTLKTKANKRKNLLNHHLKKYLKNKNYLNKLFYIKTLIIKIS